ncbi:MAG: YidC/Oxa1 family insertase periplasmic-domain containing protein [Phycisphaeraceae bacterium]|nr:YidC/Oxa1 family insertase periplasmic-domain containing protein [Phycisphaerales bacterium]MCB9859289.1 YidC/Oxa1 family insertase periplasmic-domain containing protein [Phycisphaeraceae bacterium]
MAQKPNTTLRIVIPLIAIGLALLTGWAMFRTTGKSTQTPSNPNANNSGSSSQTESVAPSTTTGNEQPDTVAQTPASTQPDTATPPSIEQPAAPSTVTPVVGTMRARVVESTAPFTPIGSLDPASGYLLSVEFEPNGAGIRALDLTDEFQDLKSTEHVRIQKVERKITLTPPYVAEGDTPPDITTGTVREFVPYGALEIYAQRGRLDRKDQSITATPIRIGTTDYDIEAPYNADDKVYRAAPELLVTPRYWSEVSPGVFECIIEDEAGNAQLRIKREYIVKKKSRTLELAQSIENLTNEPIEYVLLSWGQTERPPSANSYAGDRRRVRFGYLLSADPNKPARDRVVLAEGYLWGRSSTHVLGKKDRATGLYPGHRIWPNPQSTEKGFRLAWVGIADRFFGVVTMPRVGSNPTSKQLTSIEAIDRSLLDPSSADATNTMVLRFVSPARTIAAGETAHLDTAIYAGPLATAAIKSEPIAVEMGAIKMIAYNLGGACAFCTFEWLTHPLIWILRTLHSFVVFDWAIAIICLVVIVRTLLHPITKWSQIRMQRFGKQMQAMSPKQKAIQEKYKDDRRKMQEEMTRLWREEGISPVGMLGCLPMFLQTPVWIALYAALFFAEELRHQPAFFGLFQKISGGQWPFLADLSNPDSFIPLGHAFTLKLWGAVTGINILPLLLGVVFFVHQKYLTPPTQATMTPEQQTQQKIMKVMMVVMFPVFMYNAPSGLAIYFIANSTIAIFENKYIRAHMDKYELLDLEKNPMKKRSSGAQIRKAVPNKASLSKPGASSSRTSKPAGFRERFRQALEEQKRVVEETRAKQAKQMRQAGIDPSKPRGGKKPPKRFKDRS